MDPIALQRYISHYHATTKRTAISGKSKRNENKSSASISAYNILFPGEKINEQNINYRNFCCSSSEIEAIRSNYTKVSSSGLSKGMFSSTEYNNCTYYTVAAVDCGNFVVNGSVATVVQPLSQELMSPTTAGLNVGNSSSSNNSSNTTNEDLNSFYFYETEQFTVLWVLFAVIVLGNSAVLVTLFLNKNQKSRMNFFIKHLAIADLSVGLLNVLTDIIWRITVSWRAGNVACKFIKFLQACVMYASTYVLVALSIDRYDAITHPMNFSGSWRRARRLVAAAWTLSATFSLPMLMLYEEREIQGRTQCWIELSTQVRWQIYMCLVSMALFVLPAIIIAACYAIIVRTIWQKGALIMTTERSRGGIDRGSRRASSRGIIPRAKIKTVKMTIVIVIVFIICWSPYIIFDLLQVFEQIPRTQTNIAIATLIQSLAPLNSAANPLIYCLFSTQICHTLRRLPPFQWIITTWCYKKRTANGSSSLKSQNGCTQNGGGCKRLRNSTDSTRTLTTSLTMSKRSASAFVRAPPRVVIVERPKTILAMSEV